MPRTKNSFRSRQFVEETILDEDGSVVGTIRFNPAAVKWKRKGGHKFYTVPLAQFVEWIEDRATRAYLTKK